MKNKEISRIAATPAIWYIYFEKVAETMLVNGEDNQKVALYTGFSIEDIQALRKKLNL